MIVKMKKTTLLVSETERERLLSDLREAGIIHVKHIKPPVSHDIDFIDDKISNIDKMYSILSPYARKAKKGSFVCEEKDILENAARVSELYGEKQSLAKDKHELKKQLSWFEAWGKFDPEDLATLKAKGANLKLYRLHKDQVRDLKKNGKKNYTVLKKEKGYTYIAALFLQPAGELPFKEIIPPPTAPKKIHEKIEEMDGKVARIDSILKEEAGMLESMKGCRESLVKRREFLHVKFGMQEEEAFSYLQGFCPVDRVKKVTSIAGRRGVGYLIEDADVPEETPTLIRNPKWVRIIRPVFQFMNTIPGYNEFDISFVFLVFFSLFFAMLVGDGGYGAIFILITFLTRMKFKKAPREPFFLMYLLGGATMVWGAITGTWFGAKAIAQLPIFNNLIIGEINSFASGNQNFLIYMCFIIGAVHLTVAHIMKAFRVINSVKALGDVGWIMIVWGMFFAAGKLVVDRPFPIFAGYLLIGGMILVLVFSNPQKNMFKGMLSTLTSLPLSVIGAFSDVVSYLRLFAVGYASVVLASTFNNMALADGVGNIFAGVGAAIILLFGHTLNILLCMMAVVVHGIRLNMLEFSGHLGMQWSGKKYEPFREV